MILKNGTILKSNSTILSNYDIRIYEGRIREIKKDIIPSENEDVIDVSNKLIFPGIINSHIHLGETIFRGFTDGMSLNEYICFSHEAFKISANRQNDEIIHFNSSMLTLLESLQNGVTAVCGSRGWNAIKKIGMRGICGLPIINTEKVQKYYNNILNNDFNLEWINDKVNPIFYIQSLMSIEEHVLMRVAEIIKKNNFKYFIHISETIEENEWCKSKYGITPIQYLNKLKILNENAVLIHCVHVSDDDLRIIEQNKCNVVLCPVSNLKLRVGIPRIKEILDLDINVGLGTDGFATNNCGNMFETAKLVLLLTSGKKENLRRVLRLLTIEGYRIFGLNKTIGDIEIGYKADLVIYNNPIYLISDTDTLVSNFIFNNTQFMVNSIYIEGERIDINNQLIKEIGDKFIESRDFVLNNLNILKGEVSL